MAHSGPILNKTHFAENDQEGPSNFEAHDQSQLINELFGFLSRWSTEFAALVRERNGSEPNSCTGLRSESVSDVGESSNGRNNVGFREWAHDLYVERRIRDRFFEEPDLFAEPAWDILLDIARVDSVGKRLSVTAACIGSCVPPTTALRWLKVLEDSGLIYREADLTDSRRRFVRLTNAGVLQLERYFRLVDEHRKAPRRFLQIKRRFV